MKKISVLGLCFMIFAVLSVFGQKDGVYAEINTTRGKIIAFLEYEKVPMTVANFVGLAEGSIKNATFPIGKPYFDGAIIHRVVAGHVIQGGNPSGPDAKGTGYKYPNEIHPDLGHNEAGILGIANGGPHTNSDQFYITLANRSYLDGNYTVFGHVVEGMDVLFSIQKGDLMNSIRIIRVGKKAKKFRPDTKYFNKRVKKQWKKINSAEKKKKKDEEKFIKKNWPQAVSTDSGLKYQIEKKGTGQKASEGSVLEVIYKGKFFDGTEFASTENSGTPTGGSEAKAFKYVLGKTRVIPALMEVLKDMKKGEKRILIVPPNLAYGKSGFYGMNEQGNKRFVIPPDTSLIYKIEVLSIN
ncbi:peptidylprolyl isomerase [Bacteroidota bacterium]